MPHTVHNKKVGMTFIYYAIRYLFPEPYSYICFEKSWKFLISRFLMYIMANPKD